MKAVFADTFYWIALTLPGDAAYARAEQVTEDIVTTEEVLTEYLNFFCASPDFLRREVVSNVDAILHDPTVRVAGLGGSALINAVTGVIKIEASSRSRIG